MRILITMTGPPGTGSGTVAEAVLDELGAQGHEAFLFYPDVQDDPDAAPADPRHRVWRFPMTAGGFDFPTFPKMIPDPHPRERGDSLTCRDLPLDALEGYLEAGRVALARVVDELRPDVLECHHLWSVTWAASQLGVPYVAAAHHSDQMGYRYDERFRPWADQAATGASKILAISGHVAEEVRELYPVDDDTVEVLPSGYDDEIFRPPVGGLGDRAAALAALAEATGTAAPDDDLPLVTFSGKISHTKGVDVLLTANRALQARRPTRLVVAGTGSVEKEFGHRDTFDDTNMLFPGHLDHSVLTLLHGAAHASVIPSREEGFGVAALEAMGCGCPVVASRVGGLPEFVVGELVPPEDPDALAAALITAVERSEPERRKLGQRVHRAATEFSWPRMVERRLEIYQSAIDGIDEIDEID